MTDHGNESRVTHSRTHIRFGLRGLIALLVAATPFFTASAQNPAAPQPNGLVSDAPMQTRAYEFQGFFGGRPFWYVTDNLDAADSVGADEVWSGGASGLALSGTGVLLGIWDAGAVRVTHQEFTGGRAVQIDSPGSIHWHSTHVAGTMIAEGVWGGGGGFPAGQSIGMSHAGMLDCYDWNSDEVEMAAAAAAGLLVSNHSYGFITGWIFGDFGAGSGWYWFGDPTVSPVEDYFFGFYSTQARDWDQIAFDHPRYLICKAAGNDRNDDISNPGDPHFVWDGGWVVSNAVRDPDGQYDSISHAGIAKNLLAVGAVDDVIGGYAGPGSVVMSSFSSWGPADDGRVKPDICANGIQLVSAFHDAGDPGNDALYAIASGTSMATPNTAGSLGLLIEHWRNTHPTASDMRAATLKALVIHTADECGAAPGPDYEFGWGLLNVPGAASVISQDVAEPFTITEQVLNDGGTLELFATTDGLSPLRATICWTDPPGNVPPPALDPLTPMLVNDLDLRVVDDDAPPATFRPWGLDPLNPTAAATTGDNSVDNVEHIVVSAPIAGVHTVRITHKGVLSGGSQAFSLIISGAISITDGPPCPKTNPPVADPAGPYTMDIGASVQLDGSASSDPDAACGDSVTRYEWDLNDDGTYDVDSNNPTPTVNWSTITGLTPALAFPADPATGLPTNTIRLRVTDTAGTTGIATTTLTIYNNAPVASFTANPNPAGCGQSVNFDASGSSHGSPLHSIVQYQWDFGDGNTTNTAVPTVSHTYTQFGSYVVSLTVVDDNAPPRTDNAQVPIIVDQGNNPPVADPGGPYVHSEGNDLLLDGTASSDPDTACGDSIVSYEWDLDNDGLFDDATGATPTALWSLLNTLAHPADPATGLPANTIALRVTDSLGLTGVSQTTLTIYANTPVASFTANPNPAGCNQQVTFDASSSSHGHPAHNIVQYEWDFDGDAVVDLTTANPITAHTYTQFGTFSVTLTVTDDNAPPKTDSTATTINVDQGNSPPAANAGGPYQMDLGADIQLDGSGSSDPDGACGDSIVAYEWDLDNDGQFDDATGAAPLVTWAQITALGLTAPGTNAISLRVSDSFGATGAASTTLSIFNNNPVACFNANPNPAGCNQSITFDGSCSSHSSPLHSIVQYEWDFDNDGVTDATGQSAAHTFAQFGSFTVTLTVTDDNTPAKTNATSSTINVNQGNQAPIAAHGGPYTMPIGGNIQLNGSGSSDPDAGCGDSIVAFEWDLDNDGLFDDVSGIAPTVPWSAITALGLAFPADPATGLPTNTIRLRVTDSFGATGVSSTTLTIFNNQPLASFIATPNPAACNQLITFDASSSSHGSPLHSIVQYEWDFDGDLVVDLTTVNPVASHTYTQFGSFSVTLTVTDDNVPAKTNATSSTINVNQGNAPPAAVSGGPYISDVGANLSLNGSGSSDPDAGCGDSIVAFEWDLDNDGLFDDATGVAPTVSWSTITALGLAFPADPATGLPTNTIRLRVTDSFGATGVSGTTLTIFNNQPLASFTATPNPAACNQQITFDASSSSHGHPAHNIVQYEWDFDGDLIVDLTTVNPVASHTYTEFGTFSVTLTVTDDNTLPKTDSTALTVNVNQGNQAPSAAHGGPYVMPIGGDIQLDATGSSDPDAACGDSIVAYEWDLDFDGQYDDATGATPLVTWAQILALSPPIAFPNVANTIGLRVSDSFGLTNTTTTTLTITDPCPGDADGDGVVNLNDLAVVLGHFGESGPGVTRATGDLDLDGDVDLADLAIVLGRFGQVCP